MEICFYLSKWSNVLDEGYLAEIGLINREKLKVLLAFAKCIHLTLLSLKIGDKGSILNLPLDKATRHWRQASA